jgi:hypothetical protein
MTCSKRFGRVLQASCLGLIGMLAVVGCGGSDDQPKKDTGVTGPGLEGGVQPQLGIVKVDKPLIDFGSIDIGATSTAQTVTVTVSVAPVAINATVTAGSGFAISANTCTAMQAVGTCTISVKFSPAVVGLSSGALTIGNLSVALSGTGTKPGTFSATDRVELGTLLVNQPASAVVQIVPTSTTGITGLSCLVTGAELTIATQTCAATTAITAPCTITYTFKSATAGTKSNLVVCSAGGTTTQTVVAATVVTPSALSISPISQAYTATVGAAGVTFGFTVSNSGGSPTGNLDAKITAGATDYAITSNDCTVPLPSLGKCKIEVTFKPAAAGTKPGTLTVTDATVGSTPVTASLSGTAIAGSLVAVTPASNDFGSIEATKTKSVTFTLSNTGGTATETIVITPTDAVFSVANDLCSGRPLAPAGTCTFAVVFAPVVAGTSQANVNVAQGTDGLILTTAAVKGVATPQIPPAKLVVAPSSLDFGTTGVGVSVGPMVFTVSNQGGLATGPLTVVKNDSTSSVGGASQFNINSTTCSSALAPNASCNIVITFAPTIDRSASAVITVSDNSGTNSAFGTVVGIALAIPTIEVTCVPQDTDPLYVVYAGTPKFDDTVIGDTSPPAVCTVKNTTATGGGDTPQATGAIDIKTTGEFSVGTNNCTKSLDPNLTCTFSLVFSPTVKGRREGTVTVTTANKGAADKVLKGIGLLPVEIVEHIDRAIQNPTNVKGLVSNYDFGQVSVGAMSSDPNFGATVVTLDVYVRKAGLGNIAITGTDLYWPGDTALLDFVAEGNCPKLGTKAWNPEKPNTDAALYCTMMLVFNPQSKGAKTLTVKAASANTAGGSDTATAKGTGVGPITIQPSPLTFDAVAVGSSSIHPMSLTVCNHAIAKGEQTSMTITGTNASDVAVVTDPFMAASANKELPGGGACVYPVLRLDIPTGAATGPRAATLTITSTIAGATETASVDLVGSVVSPASLSVTASGPFADTAMGNYSGPVVFTVKNTGALRTDELYFDIPDNMASNTGIYSDFLWNTTTISSVKNVNLVQGSCINASSGTVGIGLDPGASCTFNVWFFPDPALGAVQRTSILTVSSPVGGLVVVTLTGKATNQLAITPAGPIVIGPTVFADSAGPTVDITLHNNGFTDIDPADLAYEFKDKPGQNGDPQVFRFASKTCGPALLGHAGSTNPPDFCIITLSMLDTENRNFASPPVAAPGPRSTTFEITNGDNGTQKAVVTVNGTVVEAPNLVFVTGVGTVTDTSPVNVARDFGPVAYGTTSAAMKFSVTNTGGLRANAMTYNVYKLDDETKVWEKASDFVMSGCTGDSASLNPGASCDISVSFHPTKCQVGVPNCLNTVANPQVRLMATYQLNGVATKVTGPQLFATTIDASTGPYIVDTSTTTNGVAPYDFGMFAPTATALTTKVTLAVHNETNSDYTVPAVGSATITGVATNGNLTDGYLADVPLTLNAIPAEFTITDIDCATKSPLKANLNQSCKFIVTWTPAGGAAAAVGTREVNIQLGSGPSIDVIGRVPTWPHLVAISPYATATSPMKFEDAVINTASVALSVTIQNQGERASDGDLKVVVPTTGDGTTGRVTNAVTSTGCQGTGSQIGAYLSATSNCVLVAKTTPAQLGAQLSADALKIQQNKDSATLLHLYATWTGINAAAISRQPSTTVDFDAASVTTYGTEVLSDGTKAPITLTNAASADKTGPLTFSLDNDDYAIDLDQTDSTCLSAAYAFDGLLASQSCVITVIFSPTALMAAPPSTATLTIGSANAAAVTVPLTGTPIPTLKASATAASGNTWTATTKTAAAKLAFVATSVANVAGYPTQVLTFTKAHGAPPTGLLSTSIGGGTGSTPDQFRIVDDKCVGVSLKDADQPGPSTGTQSCNVTVRFSPTSTGAKTGTLTVMDPTSGTPVDAISVDLSGTANP